MHLLFLDELSLYLNSRRMWPQQWNGWLTSSSALIKRLQHPNDIFLLLHCPLLLGIHSEWSWMCLMITIVLFTDWADSYRCRVGTPIYEGSGGVFRRFVDAKLSHESLFISNFLVCRSFRSKLTQHLEVAGRRTLSKFLNSYEWWHSWKVTLEAVVLPGPRRKSTRRRQQLLLWIIYRLLIITISQYVLRPCRTGLLGVMDVVADIQTIRFYKRTWFFLIELLHLVGLYTTGCLRDVF